MKTLKPFILVSLLLCASGVAFACGPWYYSAADCRLYRIVPPLWEPTLSVDEDFTARNILLWSKQTRFRDTAAIREALYTEWENFSDWNDLLWEMLNSAAAPFDPMTENAFCRHLVETSDTDAVRLLCWSKMYSNIRNAQRSPWYYNSYVDTDEKRQLRQLYNDLQHYTPTRKYTDRYTFLTVKCLWALGEDSNVVSLWEREKKRLKKSVFYNEAEDYVARSLSSMGWQADADAIYRKNNNVAELIPAGATIAVQLRIMLRVCPNSPQLIPILQDFLNEIDQEPARTYRWYEEETKSEAKTVLSVAHEAIDNLKVKNKAMWRYTAACILDYLGEPQKALAALNGAEGGDGNAFLRNSVRVLSFHLHSQIDTIDEAFEQYVIGEVQWMNRMLQHEWLQLPDTLRKDVSHIINWRWTSDLNKLYYNAALCRIMLTDSVGLAWRMADAGYAVRALQISNVAENWIVKLSDNRVIDSSRHYSQWVWEPWGWEKQQWNSHDYSNAMFALADKMSASTVETYRQRQLHPRDDVDRWFNARSYTDGDYWQDIIGTHYLRERNYPAAVAHLRYVSSSYQRRMNLRCNIDPFSIDRNGISHDSTHYKLHFAQRMDSLQQAMLHDRDADRRGLAMLEYAIGLENSFGMCWWLTSYAHGWTGCNLTDIEETDYALKAQSLSKQLRRKALRALRTDEARARYYARLCHNNTVLRNYFRTSTGQQIALVCDAGWQYRSPFASRYK